jgi:hypothetical protein
VSKSRKYSNSSALAVPGNSVRNWSANKRYSGQELGSGHTGRCDSARVMIVWEGALCYGVCSNAASNCMPSLQRCFKLKLFVVLFVLTRRVPTPLLQSLMQV